MINKKNILKVVGIIVLVLGVVLYLKPKKEEEEIIDVEALENEDDNND